MALCACMAIVCSCEVYMKCVYCEYVWKPRKDVVVSCPRCKRRFDYPTIGVKKMERDKNDGRNEGSVV